MTASTLLAQPRTLGVGAPDNLIYERLALQTEDYTNNRPV